MGVFVGNFSIVSDRICNLFLFCSLIIFGLNKFVLRELIYYNLECMLQHCLKRAEVTTFEIFSHVSLSLFSLESQ